MGQALLPFQPCLQLQEVWVVEKSLDTPLFRPRRGRADVAAADGVPAPGPFGRHGAANMHFPSASLFAAFSYCPPSNLLSHG